MRDTEIYALIEKCAKGEISPAEMKILEEKVEQLKTFEEIVSDRGEWLAAMQAFVEANKNRNQNTDPSNNTTNK